MKVAIDFDGVIVKRSGIPTSSDVWRDKPIEGAIESLNILVDKEIDFYILTQREKDDWPKIKRWLRDHSKKFFSFPKLLVTNVKQPGTTIYLDDRAYRFTNWNDIRKLLE